MINFSIIIPIYNAEKYLKKCLDSIEVQTFSDYEVILIDDGSKDQSLKICYEYAQNNPKYRVVHQSNSGPSVARNKGLELAQGRWICFVDSDDSVEINYLQEIYDMIQKDDADIVFIGHNKVYNDGRREVFVSREEKDTNLEIVMELSKLDMFGYTWAKVFRRDAIQNIKFDETLNLFEDEVFTCQVLPNCTKVGVVQKPIYNYNLGDGNSLIGRTHKDYCLKCDKVYKAWKDLVEENSDTYDFMENKANEFVSRCYYYAFEREVEIKSYFNDLKKTLFFEEHTDVICYDDAVRKENYKKMWFEKKKYQAKVQIASVLHRKGRN